MVLIAVTSSIRSKEKGFTFGSCFILSLAGWLYCLGAVLRHSVVAEDSGMGSNIARSVVARNETEIQEGAWRHVINF